MGTAAAQGSWLLHWLLAAALAMAVVAAVVVDALPAATPAADAAAADAAAGTLPATARFFNRRVRLQNGWDPVSGFLTAAGVAAGAACDTPEDAVVLRRDEGAAAARQQWVLEPTAADASLVRLRSGCGGVAAYVERTATREGGSWAPNWRAPYATIRRTDGGVARQLWRFGPRGAGGCVTVTNEWEPRSGVLTRLGDLQPNGSYKTTRLVAFDDRNPLWPSQCWFVLE